ncbi:MAG: hypothetical protein K2X66_15940 [Cyanobacteria bacterium]|nr:hypothetical protein [Cyanobacteriota bacterium]
MVLNLAIQSKDSRIVYPHVVFSSGLLSFQGGGSTKEDNAKTLPPLIQDKLEVSQKADKTSLVKPSLESFIQDLEGMTQAKGIRWRSSGVNLESKINGYPVRLAEVTRRGGAIYYKLQVFPKGWLGAFKSVVYNVDALPQSQTGQKLSAIYQQALSDVPEAYRSNRGRNRGILVFDLGRTPFALVFPKSGEKAAQWLDQSGVLFFVKRKSGYYGEFPVIAKTPPVESQLAESQLGGSVLTTTVTNPLGGFPKRLVLPEGVLTEQGFKTLLYQNEKGAVIQKGMDAEAWQSVLAKAGVTVEKLKELAQLLIATHRGAKVLPQKEEIQLP